MTDTTSSAGDSSPGPADADSASSADRTADAASDAPPPAELRYDSLPDAAAGVGPDDSELDYDMLPDPLDRSAVDDTELDYDALPDVAETRPAADREYRIEDARAAVEHQHELADARVAIDRAYDQAPATGQELATKHEFDKRPAEAMAAPDFVRERAVIASAKADLAAREVAGDRYGGDPINRADEWHWQGQNDRGFEGSCGLASVADVGRQCGQDVTENDVVENAVDSGLCRVYDDDPANSGGTDVYDRFNLLSDQGIKSDVVYPQTPEQLAQYVDDDKGVITRVNGDRLWTSDADLSPIGKLERAGQDLFGKPRGDHAVVVTGTVRDASGDLKGFVLNDHGHPEGAGRVVEMDQWDDCWTDVSGNHDTNVTRNTISTERTFAA